MAFYAFPDGLVDKVDGPGACGQAHYAFADVQLPQVLGDALAHVFSVALCPGGRQAQGTWEVPSGTRTLAGPGTRVPESELKQQRKLGRPWDGGWWSGNGAVRGPFKKREGSALEAVRDEAQDLKGNQKAGGRRVLRTPFYLGDTGSLAFSSVIFPPQSYTWTLLPPAGLLAPTG